MSSKPPKASLQERKEMLLARASIERIELAAHLGQVRAGLSPSTLWRMFVPSTRQASRLPGLLLRSWQTLQRHPLASSVASMLLTRLRVGRLARLVPLGGGVFAAYELFKWWRSRGASR